MSALGFIFFVAQIFVRRYRGECVTKLNENTRDQRKLVNCEITGNCIGKCRYSACKLERMHLAMVVPIVPGIMLGFVYRAEGVLWGCIE